MGQSSCSEVFQAPRSKATKTPRPTWQPPVTLSPRRPPDLQQLREELQAKERALQLLRNEAIDERLLLCILDSARQPTSPHLSASVSQVQPLVNDGDAAAGACQPKGLAKEADVPEIQEVVPVMPVVPVVSDNNALAPVLPGGEAPRATTAGE